MHEEMVITERELMAAKTGIDSARGREGKKMQGKFPFLSFNHFLGHYRDFAFWRCSLIGTTTPLEHIQYAHTVEPLFFLRQ